jgi:hypothetical protein
MVLRVERRTMSRSGDALTGHRVLIAGGGVAALETTIALRSLAEERVDVELLLLSGTSGT